MKYNLETNMIEGTVEEMREFMEPTPSLKATVEPSVVKKVTKKLGRPKRENRFKHWTPVEDSALWTYYVTHENKRGYRPIANQLGRTPQACCVRLTDLRKKKPNGKIKSEFKEANL